MRSLLLLLLCFTLYRVTYGQDRLITVDSVTIPCHIQSATSRLVYFTDLTTNRQDSLPTLRLRELHYANSVRVLVVPTSQWGQVRTLAFADFDRAWRQGVYTVLLHAKTSRYDLTFRTGQVTLTNEGRRQALALVTLLKTRPAIHVKLTVHTDTLGQAISNKALSDRRAAALQNFFTANGVDNRNLLVEGRGESEASSQAQALNRRIELQVTAIDGVKELQGETYIPQRQPTPVTPTTTATAEPIRNSVPRRTESKVRRIGAVVYGEGMYALASMSKTWVDPGQGIGILQGFGGGLLLTYYLTPRFGLTLQGGYGQWAVQRRYRTDDGDIVYTNEQSLKRLVGQVGFRVYLLPTVYLQPTAGGQLLTLNSQNSETHPEGPLQNETKKLMPIFGGALGFEWGKKRMLFDLAAQYQLTPNTAFDKATEPLHYAGLRLGIGFRPRP